MLRRSLVKQERRRAGAAKDDGIAKKWGGWGAKMTEGQWCAQVCAGLGPAKRKTTGVESFKGLETVSDGHGRRQKGKTRRLSMHESIKFARRQADQSNQRSNRQRNLKERGRVGTREQKKGVNTDRSGRPSVQSQAIAQAIVISHQEQCRKTVQKRARK
eukprot:418463-Pleurochrysis_carterae.AAC.1